MDPGDTRKEDVMTILYESKEERRTKGNGLHTLKSKLRREAGLGKREAGLGEKIWCSVWDMLCLGHVEIVR